MVGDTGEIQTKIQRRILDQRAVTRQKMSSNSFRKLRLTCVSPAESEQALCSAGNPQLRPQPPAQRNPERIVTARELVGVGGKTKSVKLPPAFGSSRAGELVHHPPAERKTNITHNFGIRFLQHEADKRRQLSRSKCFLLEKEKALTARAKRLSEEESVLSRKQLEAEKTAADLEPYQRLSVTAPEAKKMAQDAIREQLKTQKEVEELERKIRALKETEELVLRERDKEFEEEISENELMDLEEKEMLEYMNFMDEMHEKDQIVKRLQEEKEKLKTKADCLMEKEKIMDRLIEQKEEKLKQIKCTLENLNSDGMWNTANSFKQVCEKMAEVYVEIFDRFCGTDFPLVMLQDFDDASLDLLEKIPAEKLHKIQMQHWKDYAVSDRLKKEAEWEAMQEQWRQKSLARSLAPAGKLIRKKLMPRSRPSQTVKKEEQLETKNQEYQHFLLNQFLS